MVSDRIELKIPSNPEKADELLLYLQSEFEKFRGWSGAGHREQDGTFVERVEGQIGADSGELTPTTWVLLWDKDGLLSSISVEAPAGSPGWWKDAVNSTYQNALASALSADKAKFFRRDQFAYIGPNLDGEYWIAGWRIAPAIPDDEGDFVSERIVLLDHWTEAVNDQHSMSIGQVKADRIMVLLSLFVGIGFYRIPVVKKWVITGPGESKRYQLGYRSGTPYPENMPKKGEECSLGKSVAVDRRDLGSTSLTGRLHLPSDTRELFRAFENLSQPDQRVFFGAAALHHIGLPAGSHLPSVSLSYQVAAVEALAEKQSLEGIVDLVRKYNPQVSDEFIKHLYGKVRSAHFHAGEFPLGEFDPKSVGPIMDPEHLSQTDLRVGASLVLQPTLIDWLLDHSSKNPS